jgi:hypothetical protein
MRTITRTIALGSLAALTACMPPAADPGTGPGAPAGAPASQVAGAWRVATLPHLDLWLHGFAMLTADTARVPLFERGYRQQMRQLRQQRGVTTALDANQDRLSARFVQNPALVNAQFLAFYFPSWDVLSRAAQQFVQAQGDPRAAADAQTQAYFGILGATFPAAADRDWLRLFVLSLQEERTRFYDAWWTNEQASRAAARQAVENLWLSTYRDRFARFLSNSQQAGGDIVLSMPLGGEGRTINRGRLQNAIAVTYPATAATAMDALYVFAHELVHGLTATAITDYTTPADQRAGVVAAWSGNAPVRAGALLLQRISPDLVQGYMRYYLRAIGQTAPAGDPTAAFTSAFQIPENIRLALDRQIEAILGGI